MGEIIEILFSEQVIQDRISMSLPTGYKQMEKRHIGAKYPIYKDRDVVILTNEKTTVNFIFYFNDGVVEEHELEDFRDQMFELVKDSNPALVFLEKSTIDTGEFKVAYFEIVTPSLDKDIYNFMYYFMVGEKLVTATFNCYDDEKDYWRAAVHRSVESLRSINKAKDSR